MPSLLTRRIFILGASIFEEGIAHLLKVATDLQVTRTKYTNDIKFMEDIKRNQPDVILLNESTPLNFACMLDMLFSMPSLAGGRVIIVRLDNNMIDVYDFPKQAYVNKPRKKRRQVIVTKRDELVAHCVRG